MKRPKSLLALALGVTLAFGSVPAVALAEEADEQAVEAPQEESVPGDEQNSEGEQVQEEAVAGEVDESAGTDAEGAPEEESEGEPESFKGLEGNSFRYHNGKPVDSGFGAGPGDGSDAGTADLQALANGAWRKNSSGQYVSSNGQVIKGAIRRGVDVSEWQDKIDWAKVKADDISYAIIRVGGTFYSSRKQYADDYYEYNAKELERLGIPYGVYFFSTAYTVEDAKKEADYTLAALKGKNISLPVYYDLEYEDAAARLSPTEWAAITKAFCDKIEAAGYTAGVYASTYWWEHHLTDPIFNNWTKWVAQYYSSCEYKGSYDMWQCTSTAQVNGITTGGCDLNFDFGVEDVMGTEDRQSKVWKRLWGENAVDTMQAVVKTGWESSESVVVATKNGYWDALSASSLAGALKAPVLLSDTDSVDKQTVEEIGRLGARKAYLIGGNLALTENVEQQLHDMGVEEVIRVAAGDAAGTAREVAAQLPEHSDTCFVATSNGYWDALSASPIAYAKGMPIFLSNATTKLLDDATLEAIKNNYSKVVIVGGTLVVPDEVVEQLKGAGIAANNIVRKAGGGAIETSVHTANYGVSLGMSSDKMGVATGNGYWDALTGGAFCGKNNAVIALINTSNRSSIGNFVVPNKGSISTGYVFGGPLAVKPVSFNLLVGVTG